MESKEYITYSRRAKAVERPQQSLVRNNQFHGHRSTKRWVEETAQQQCRGGSIEKAEQLQQAQGQQQQQYYFPNEGGAARGLDVTPCRTTTRKKEGRGVHFKQENDQTSSRLETKFGNQGSPLLQPAIVRKDGFPESQAAALSPISLNVAAGGRQMANSFIPAKHSPAAAAVAATLAKGGVPQTLGQISVISPDGRVQTLPSGRDEEGRQVVWCNAAFEADDDLRSQDSAHSNRYSPASCSKNVESDVCGPLLVVPSTNEKPQHQQQQAWGPSGVSHVNVNANLSAIFCPEASLTAAIASAVARTGNNLPTTVMAKSPEQDFKVPQIAQLELESSAAGEWYTPMGSEASSHTSRSFAHGHERPTEHSNTRRALAATPSFKTVAPPQTMPSHPNRHVPGSRGGRSVSCSNSRKYPKYFTEVHPPNCESASRTNSNPRACLSHDHNGPRSAKRVVGGGASSILAGRVEPVALNPPRNSTTPKTQRFQEDPAVEADLEADIEHEIEQEISMEILQLSERLAALHAKHETRRVGGGGGCPERPKTGGISCPQTPLRNAPSPCGSDSAKGKRRGRVVAAKFLQYTNDGSSNMKRDKSVTRTERPAAAKPVLFSDGPFLGRPNPPRRSLGTPSRLLTKGKQNGQQQQQQQGSGSPCHMVKERIMEEQPRGIGASKVTIDEYMRSRAMIESGGGGGGKRVVRVLSHKNFGDEERKEWNDRGIAGQSKKKENHHHDPPAPILCTGSTASAAQHQPHFYPEFERKVDWVKTLRTDPIPAAHPCGAALSSSSPAPALDERFLKQKSERQDVNAWLRENIGIVGNCELPNFPPHVSGTTGIYDGALQQAGGGGGVQQADSRKTRAANEEEDSTNSRSTRPSNGWTSSLSNARPATPNRCTPNRPTTPSRGNARTVPSRYGTPVKAVPSSARDHPGNNNKSTDPKPTIMENNSRPKTWYGQTTPSKSFNNKDSKVWLPMRKASPTTRKGYPGEPPAATNNGSKDRQGVVPNSNNNAEVSAKGERKITIVGGSEYEKFVQEGVVVIDKRVPAARKNVDGGDGGFKAQGGVGEPGVRPKTPSSSVKQQRGTCELAPPPNSDDPMAAKKIFIRCSDLIKDKHSMLVKGKQRRLAGQGGLPSEGQDSDDSGFGRRSNNTRTDLSELDGDNSRSDEASIIEESTYIQDPRLSQRRAVEVGGGGSCKSSSERSSLTPDFDIVYEHEAGIARGSSYRPEDYTLEMMLQYVDTLKCEREALPRIRAVKDVAAATGGGGNSSPRDSGCIKRRKEGEKRNRFYFNAGGEANKVQVPKCANSTENDGLSPNEIEGLDLESFWCLVGEREGPILI